MSNKEIEYFLNEDYSFSVIVDEAGRKIGKLVDLKKKKVLAENMSQKVIPENIPNLLNVAKIIINAAWQDGKIHPKEKEAFDTAFKNVDFTAEQSEQIKQEFIKPTPIKELLKKIKSHDEKMLILETSILLIIADGEFHPKEKDFITNLIEEFALDTVDFAILYRILPQSAKKYIVKENLYKRFDIKADEIDVLNKFIQENEVKDVNHHHVYANLLSKWKTRKSRYSRMKKNFYF